VSVETALALFANAMSLVAVVVTVRQTVDANRHSRLSVQPNVRIDVMQDPDKGVRVILRNTGLGPAVIRSLSIEVSGARRVPGRPVDLVNWIFGDDFPDNSVAWTLDPGDAIVQGERYVLLKCPVVEKRDVEASGAESGVERAWTDDEIMERIVAARLTVSYESMYGDKRTVTMRSPFT
jgi:hypothetical protein